jgi:DNA repair protein RecN (Recombination protein N)
MLHELTIQRIALIDHLHLKLSPGFNVFTGETGAGKSIVLDAIGLLLGNRASADLIRTGADSAVVEAVFEVNAATRAKVEEMLSEWGIALEDSTILVSRELYRSGRNVCRINGRLATVQMLRELGTHLIQQHGQHDHQGLLRPEEQLRLLDLYGGHAALCQETKARHSEYIRCKREYEASQLDEQARAQRLDMLDFQIREIAEAKLRPGEEDELRERKKKLQHLERISSALEAARVALEGAERTMGAVSLLASAYEEVAAAAQYDEQLQEAAELLQTAQVHADEAARVVWRQLDGLDADPAELDAIETRLAQIRGLQRKYGATVEEILQYQEQAIRERDELLNHEARLEQLREEVARAERRLAEAADKLHQARLDAASRLSAEVAAVLKQLSMPNAQLKVDVAVRTDAEGQVQYSEHGMDQVQFLFSANRGEEPKALQKVASGGELSRILLALKAVLADVDDVETLIFDEIDTGVSGAAAQAVADQMVRIAHSRQVLCVTHSAALAAAARTHFFIEKQDDKDATVSMVTQLDEPGRIRELARLLGAGIADETALSHARAMLERMAERTQAAN